MDCFLYRVHLILTNQNFRQKAEHFGGLQQWQWHLDIDQIRLWLAKTFCDPQQQNSFIFTIVPAESLPQECIVFKLGLNVHAKH